ncbi:MAG: alpha/beta fold hydrolase [Sphingopyxis sp.]|nr:alpha/beta fold hydrolase [Sphingopyxis sp.]
MTQIKAGAPGRAIATEHKIVDGLSIRYARTGPADGTPILLTCPYPESLLAFRGIWDDLAMLGPVLAIDLPGFGRSQEAPHLMSPAAMGAFLPSLLDAFGLERVHAVVPDVGTLAALFAAAAQPERFASIVAGSGGAHMDLLGQPLRDIVNSSRKDFAGVDGGEQVVALIRDLARVALPEDTLEDYRLSALGDRWNNAAEFVRAYPRDLPLLADALPGIEVPVLIISGSDDPFVPPSNGDFLAQHLPFGEARVIDAGHFVWEDAAGEYAAAVTAWIAQHS